MAIYLVAIIVAMASGLGGFVYGIGVGGDKVTAQQKKLEDVADKAATKVAIQSAEAIAKINVTNKTIYQKATREVVTNPIYTDCVNTDSMRDAINQAITGRGADQSKLPRAGAVGRQDVRSGKSEADRSGGTVSNLPASGNGS